MLRQEDVSGFAGFSVIGKDIVKFSEMTRKVTYRYYMKLAGNNKNICDLLMISHNLENDLFATFVLKNVPDNFNEKKLTVLPLNTNEYGFSNIVLAPHEYHSTFKGGALTGLLDKLTLCIPTHKSEFSGSETINEFKTLTRAEYIIPISNWTRSVCPKIKLRFDNHMTKGGTNGEYVLVKYNLLIREINELNGVDGFIEIINYKGAIVEILSKEKNTFIFIMDRKDAQSELIGIKEIMDKLWKFLTQ